MSGNGERYKRREGQGKTKVTCLVPPDHPVVRGVMKAKKILGGDWPEHVGEIRILPDRVEHREKGKFVNGHCWSRSSGPSMIKIYTGSIERAAGGTHLEEDKATETTLHEVGHSRQGWEIQTGAMLGAERENGWYEADANKFVDTSVGAYHKKKNEGKPRLTWPEILQIQREQ